MTKIGTLLFAAFVSVEILAVYASANQNVFAERDDTVSTSAGQNTSNDVTATSSRLKIELGRSVGRGKGGDRLHTVKSGSGISFQPRNAALSAKFVEKMNEELPTCVAQAANDAGYRGAVSSINIKHKGGYVNRRVRGGRSWSMHSTGRALDISGIDVTIGGRKLSVPLTKPSYNQGPDSAKGAFYRKFVSCWNESVKNKCGSKGAIDCVSGSRRMNRLHTDHVHLALPFCPKEPGIALL